MITKTWLPHLIVAIVAVSMCAFVGHLTVDEEARAELYEGIYSPGEGEEIRPPSSFAFFIASLFFALIGGFYLGVAVTNFSLEVKKW